MTPAPAALYPILLRNRSESPSKRGSSSQTLTHSFASSPEPGTPVMISEADSAGGLETTGYLIRLVYGGKVAAQDIGVLLRDRGSLPILPAPLVPKRKDLWPFYAPKVVPGTRVRLLSSGKIGLVEKWLPEKRMWGVRMADSSRKACRADTVLAIVGQLAPKQKVTVAEQILVLADPDDPEDFDLVVKPGTRGIITELDEDGGLYVEFESKPGEALPINSEDFGKLRFFHRGVWAVFDDTILQDNSNS